MPVSSLELEFDSLWESLYPDLDLETEVLLIPGRKFRFDYAHIEAKVAIELNGQIWRLGAHSSGTGLQRDYEKLNLAQALGWCVFQLSSEMITRYWADKIAQVIRARNTKYTKIP
ncbi:MAG: hypothetical protein ACRC11_16450 [Xenococcaceae cyanobacterium]